MNKTDFLLTFIACCLLWLLFAWHPEMSKKEALIRVKIVEVVSADNTHGFLNSHPGYSVFENMETHERKSGPYRGKEGEEFMSKWSQIR